MKMRLSRSSEDATELQFSVDQGYVPPTRQPGVVDRRLCAVPPSPRTARSAALKNFRPHRRWKGLPCRSKKRALHGRLLPRLLPTVSARRSRRPRRRTLRRETVDPEAAAALPAVRLRGRHFPRVLAFERACRRLVQSDTSARCRAWSTCSGSASSACCTAGWSAVVLLARLVPRPVSTAAAMALAVRPRRRPHRHHHCRRLGRRQGSASSRRRPLAERRRRRRPCPPREAPRAARRSSR